MNENPAYKSGFATLIGRPNVGKSTLMNRLIGQKIAITSNKPQTTRNRIQTVLTLDEGQIVFLDTPGIHKAKNKLGDYMVNVAEAVLRVRFAAGFFAGAGSARTLTGAEVLISTTSTSGMPGIVVFFILIKLLYRSER